MIITKFRRKINKYFLKNEYSFLMECLKLSLKSDGKDVSYYHFKETINYFLNNGKFKFEKSKISGYLKLKALRINIIYFFQGVLESRQQLRYARMMLNLNKDSNDEKSKLYKDFAEYMIKSYPENISFQKKRTKRNYLIFFSLILIPILILVVSK